MNRDLRQFQSDAREQDQLDAMDVNLTSDTLLQLLEKKIFEIIVAGQVGRENEKRAAADQQNGNKGDNNASSGHSCSLDGSCSVGNPQHCGCVILPNHMHEIYEVFVLTGNSPLLMLNSQQDKETTLIRATGTTSGTGRMLKSLLRLVKS